jgi:transcriptional regulator with XRE-family HTH domain
LKVEINYEEVGARIRKTRKSMGLTQEQLAEICEISAAFEGHIERGTRKLSVDTLVQIANALNVTVDYLLTEARSSDLMIIKQVESILSSKGKKKYHSFLSAVKIMAEHLDEIE